MSSRRPVEGGNQAIRIRHSSGGEHPSPSMPSICLVSTSNMSKSVEGQRHIVRGVSFHTRSERGHRGPLATVPAEPTRAVRVKCGAPWHDFLELQSNPLGGPEEVAVAKAATFTLLLIVSFASFCDSRFCFNRINSFATTPSLQLPTHQSKFRVQSRRVLCF